MGWGFDLFLKVFRVSIFGVRVTLSFMALLGVVRLMGTSSGEGRGGVRFALDPCEAVLWIDCFTMERFRTTGMRTGLEVPC